MMVERVVHGAQRFGRNIVCRHLDTKAVSVESSALVSLGEVGEEVRGFEREGNRIVCRVRSERTVADDFDIDAFENWQLGLKVRGDPIADAFGAHVVEAGDFV